MSKRKLALILPWREKVRESKRLFLQPTTNNFTPTLIKLIKPIKLIKLISPSMTRKLLALTLTAITSLTAAAQQQVAIFSINDFHGAFVRNDHKGIVGAPSVLQTLDSLKQVYPCNITVSAGDNFGGSYFYNVTHGALLPVFFNAAGIRLSAVGNHEFDDGQRSLADKWNGLSTRPEGWDIDYVCANVRSTQTKAIPNFAQPVASVPITLPDGRPFRVAFVGLIASSTPQQASMRKLAGLTFDGRYEAVLDSVMKLPEGNLVKDANLRLLLTHVGSNMNDEGQPIWDDKDAAHLQQINSPLWHGILSSHSHKRVCGTINDAHYPIVQGRWHGDYISMLLCTIDNKTLQVTKVEPRTIAVTPKDTLEPAAARLQAQVDSLLLHTTTPGGTPIGTRLTTAIRDLSHDRDHKYCQTVVGELVCKSYAEAFRHAAELSDDTPIIGCSHFGSIRSGFTKGPISVLDVGEVLPFSNALKVYQVKGSLLIELVNFGFHNLRYGWLQTGNLKIERNGNQIKSLTYVSPQGKEVPIVPYKKYYLVADEFITTGGDGYSPSFFPAKQEVKQEGMPSTTDAFVQYLKAQKFIGIQFNKPRTL